MLLLMHVVICFLSFVEVNADQYGNIYCIKIPDFNYSSEISTYGEPNFGFLGRHVLQEYGGITADLYVGQAVDGVGPMNCIFYCDAETCRFSICIHKN